MTNAPAPVIIRTRRSLPLIWVVPLLALVAGGWLILRNTRAHGPVITIRFESGAGIEPDKTILEYKGVAVGIVQSVQLDDKLAGVYVQVQLARHAASLARADSEFWLVRPEIGFSGIKGLDTLFSGPRIKVRPGTGGAPARDFVARHTAPLMESGGRGRAFVLRSDKLGALTPGAPVFFREVKVGFVETHRLTPDADGVLVRILVRTPYDQLVHADSRFWNAGGVSVKVGLLGAEIRSNSLESLVTGGVAFATPETAGSSPAAEGTEFALADELDKDWLKWKTKIPLPEPAESEGPDSADAEPVPGR